MNDKEFLIWLHGRLNCIHNENTNVDYMLRLTKIIKAMPDDTDKEPDTRGMVKLYDKWYKITASIDCTHCCNVYLACNSDEGVICEIGGTVYIAKTSDKGIHI